MKFVSLGIHMSQSDCFVCLFFNPRSDTMLATVTSVVSFSQYNGSVSPSPMGNTSTFPTWQPETESNITKPHRCLQVLYEDIGDSR